jgi:hypothetical protein
LKIPIPATIEPISIEVPWTEHFDEYKVVQVNCLPSSRGQRPWVFAAEIVPNRTNLHWIEMMESDLRQFAGEEDGKIRTR